MSVGVRRRGQAHTTLAILVWLSIAAIAGAEVDASRVDRLQAGLSRGAVVRLTTTSGETERLRDVRLDEAGIVSARPLAGRRCSRTRCRDRDRAGSQQPLPGHDDLSLDPLCPDRELAEVHTGRHR